MTIKFEADDGQEIFFHQEAPMKTAVRTAAKAAAAWLASPQARRYEVALALGVYEAVRAAFGSA